MAIKHLTLLRMTYSDRNGQFVDQYSIDTCLGEGQATPENHHNFLVPVQSELGDVIKELADILREHVSPKAETSKVE
jgi:hypothetical protein